MTMSPNETCVYAIKDGVRQRQRNVERALEANKSLKLCGGCAHWVRLHPQHGACVGRWRQGDHSTVVCTCEGFVDPFPGRPDRVFTREQVDRLSSQRWKLVRNRLYLMTDGRYGVLDEWTDTALYFVPSPIESSPSVF